MTQGHQVVVGEFADNPMDAVAHHLSLQPMPQPDPARLAPHEVLIRIRSAAVGWVDLLMTSGQYQHMPEPPYTPGMEYTGEVLATGAAVDPAQVQVGDRVLADGLQVGPRSGGRYRSQGGFATYAVLPASAALRLPDTLSFDEGSCLLGNYETAYHCLVVRGRLKAGETVLILGATGSTGLAAVHVAKLMGATVIAAGRSDEKLAVVKAQGADHVVNITHADGSPGVRPFRGDVKALTGDRGVDLVYDGVGGEVSLESLRCVAFGARFVIVGWASTPAVAKGRGQRGAPNANQLPTNLIMMKGLDVLGAPMVIATLNDPSLRAPRLARILQWVADGRLKPQVSRTWSLADFKDAMRAKWNGEVIGGCVLHP
ncbi:MAG: NADPH:quinone oxidoreductase family protein [Burkholderiaceae bacterium]